MRRRLPRPLILAVLLACLVLGLPTAVTGAYWTTRHDAPATTAGTGRWCSVPNHQLQPNVYPLTTFPTIPLPEGGTVRMLAVPVVNNASYGPAKITSTVKVRLWACNAQALTTAPTMKVTAWRKASAATTDPLVWNAAATSPLSTSYSATLPAQRLNLTTGWGKKLQDFHRLGSNNGTSVTDPLRTQYSWIIGHGRTKTTPTTDASCTYSSLLGSCEINTNGYPKWADAFRADTGTAGDYTNSVTYTARKFWTGSGTWPTTTPQPTDLQLDAYTPALSLPYNTGTTTVTNNQLSPTTTNGTPTGRQVEWVVMEWWGTTPASYGDLAAEVLLE